MKDGAVKAGVLRDWLAELRGAEEPGQFAVLVGEIAEAVPALAPEVCRIARDKGGEELEEWARKIFASGEEAEPVTPLKAVEAKPAEPAKADSPIKRRVFTGDDSDKRFREPESKPEDAAKPATDPPFPAELQSGVESEQPKAEAKPEAEPEAESVKANLPAVIAPGPQGFFSSSEFPTFEPEEILCLDPAAPFDNAQKLISLRAWHRREGIRTLQYWQRAFWDWNGKCWQEADEETVRASMWQQLNAAEKFLKGGKRARFEPKMSDVSATLDALRAAVNLRAGADNAMPGWFGEDRPDGDLREVVACQNGILHIPSRTLLPHTPRYWSPNALDFAYDPAARAPGFEKFLGEIWPGDSEAQQCLLEMFGLCLTDVTKYQKGFMFVGPRRGGRGTIGRVLRGLIDVNNYIGTSLKAFSEGFGMENFIGKKVAVFSDARLDGVRQQNLSTIVERLLLITGEDDMHINRKNTKYWEGKLNCRVVVFSNELIRLPDESGALPGRFLTFRMQQSFYGREDPNLTEKLLVERPGILNLALDALAQLRSRGRLLQCKTGAEMSESLSELSSDISGFVEECCIVGPNQQVLCQELFKHFQSWSHSRGVRHGWGENQFSEKLRSAVPTITRSRPSKNNPKRLTLLIGVGHRPLLDRTAGS